MIIVLYLVLNIISHSFASSNQAPVLDNLNFKPYGNSNEVEEREDDSTVFFTTKMKNDHIIHYPKESISNPKNRLTLLPEELATVSSVVSTLKTRLAGASPTSSEIINQNQYNFTTEKIPLGNNNFSEKLPELAPDDRVTYLNVPGRQKNEDLDGTAMGTQDNSETNDTMGASMKPSAPYSEVVQTMLLTLNIVQKRFWESDENVVFSPLSIANVLALMLLGSGGQTYQEIARALQLEALDVATVARFHKNFENLLQSLAQNSVTNASVAVANSLFVDDHFSILSQYRESCEEFYNADVQKFNFHKNQNVFQEIVNAWVNEKTHGKIKAIVDEPPSQTTTLSLINAVYFNGNWKVPFPKRFTRERVFHVSETEQIMIPMMVNILKLPYVSQNGTQMVALPYRDNCTSLFMILPRGNGIDALKRMEREISETNLSKGEILRHMNSMQERKVALKIPKMRFSTDGEMGEILSSLGISSAFNPSIANFTEISMSGGLYVSSVHHKAMLEINEQGTEAAAVTIATGDRTIDEVPTPFIANKPFIFFIYHNKAKAVLFWGRVVRPEWF